MSGALDWLRLAGGAVLLYLGAEWFVAGASALAIAIRIPQIIIGLTVVAYGTSAPEVVVGIQAAVAGHGDVALGNVIGSNIANIGLILGVTALIRPIAVGRSLRRRELPVLLFGTLLVPLLLLDGVVSGVEGAGLVVLAMLYTALMIRSARRASGQSPQPVGEDSIEPLAQLAGKSKIAGPLRVAIKAALGLGILLLGGSWFIDGAVSLARGLGISERVVGLTIVAIGTSLPELVTSVVAARRGHSDLALGNVVGSNIFNIFLCLGLAALVRRIDGTLARLGMDVAVLAVLTLLLAVYARGQRHISRREGAIALLAYVSLMVLTVARG